MHDPQHHGPHAHHHGHHSAGGHHSFADVERYAAIFDDPERDAWQRPAELVAALGIAPGATVAEIGSGKGYFLPHLARAVGSGGKVIALDEEPKMVAHMQARMVRDGFPAVTVRLAGAADPALAPGEADLILFVNAYHHIEGRVDYFARLIPAVVPEGRLAIVEPLPQETPHGPPAAVRIAPETVRHELEQAGWTLARSLDLLPEQYVLIFAAPGAMEEGEQG